MYRILQVIAYCILLTVLGQPRCDTTIELKCGRNCMLDLSKFLQRIDNMCIKPYKPLGAHTNVCQESVLKVKIVKKVKNGIAV